MHMACVVVVNHMFMQISSLSSIHIVFSRTLFFVVVHCGIIQSLVIDCSNTI
jgi:hypothetical protein